MAYKPNSLDAPNKNQPNGYEMVIYGYKVNRWKIKDYFTDEILNAIAIYFRIKKYGWPYGPAWAENPANIVRLVFALDEEAEKIRDAHRQS